MSNSRGLQQHNWQRKARERWKMTVILDILKSLPTLLKCSKEGLMCASPINLMLLSPANWELLFWYVDHKFLRKWVVLRENGFVWRAPDSENYPYDKKQEKKSYSFLQNQRTFKYFLALSKKNLNILHFFESIDNLNASFLESVHWVKEREVRSG